MRKTLGLSALSATLLAFPILAIAQSRGLMGALVTFNQFLNGVVGVIITMAIIVFFWGLVRYLTDVGEAKHDGLIMMFYGLIALFVMVSVWGIIHLLQVTFNVQGQGVILPGVVSPTDYINRGVN